MVNADVEVHDVIYDGKPHSPLVSVTVKKPSNPTNPCEIAYSLDNYTWFDDLSKLEYAEIGNYEFYVKVKSEQQFDPYSTLSEDGMIKQFADFNKKFV